MDRRSCRFSVAVASRRRRHGAPLADHEASSSSSVHSVPEDFGVLHPPVQAAAPRSASDGHVGPPLPENLPPPAADGTVRGAVGACKKGDFQGGLNARRQQNTSRLTSFSLRLDSLPSVSAASQQGGGGQGDELGREVEDELDKLHALDGDSLQDTARRAAAQVLPGKRIP